MFYKEQRIYSSADLFNMFKEDRFQNQVRSFDWQFLFPPPQRLNTLLKTSSAMYCTHKDFRSIIERIIADMSDYPQYPRLRK